MATAEKTDAVTVNPNVNVIEDMISNLKLDIEARDEQIVIKEEAADFISDANERIKKGSQALSFMTDYMTDKQIEDVEELDLFHVDFEQSSERGRLNEIAQIAFDTIKKTKDGQMTNGDLYESYAKQTDETPVKYGEFNIKLRSLFSSMRLLREIPEDAVKSHDHIIKVNGFTPKK